MKFADRLKFTTTGTSAASISDGTAVAGCRNLAQVIAAGALSLTDVGVPFCFDDGAGNWENSLFNLGGTAQAPTLSRTQVLGSSAGGTTPATFTGSTLTVFNEIPSSFLNGVSLTQLSAAGALAATDVIAIGQSGTEVQTTVDAFYTYLVNRMTAEGKFSAATLTVATPTTQTVGNAFVVSGTWAGVQPTALDYALADSGTMGAWNNAVTSLTINTNGTYSFSITPTTASVNRTITVRDHNNTSVVSAASAAYVVNPNTVLTIATPSSPQTVGAPFNVTGTYTGTAPAALDYLLSDGGSWIAATSPTISGGTYSFSLTPVGATAGRTITVRDHTYTSITSPASGSYSVNAAAGSTVSGVTVTAASSTVSGGATDQMSATVAGTNSPSQSVTWSIDSGPGTISSTGLYTAAAATSSDQTVVIRATSTQDNTKSGTVTITIPATATSTVTGVSVTGTLTTVQGNQTDQLTATVAGTNSPSQAVTWSIQSGPGSVNSSGVYQAPLATSGAQTAVVKATSTQDNTKSGTITITAQPTVSPYGTTLKSALGSADAYSTVGSNKLYTGSNTGGGVWVFNGSKPNTASTGWSQSNTVPPAATSDRSTNGMYPMSIAAAGSGSTNNTYLYAPIGQTTTWYFWMEINGIYTVMNSSGTVVTL
jgi:hypothetical protein